jgi:GT2 family glycosyltransferase
VTVAILAFNRREPLAVTLGKTLGELDYPADRLEVIVVDNASTDGTAEMVARDFPQVRLIVSEANEGIAGWNRAFAAGRGDWFLVLDDDCYVEGDALRRAVSGAQDADADLVSFTVTSPDPGQTFSELYRTGVLSFWGCSVLVSARAAHELGGFDERLFIWAHELDFTMRLLDRGFTHLVLPDVRSLHMKPFSRLTPYAVQRNMRNFGYVVGKLLRPRDAVAAMGSLMLRAVIETAANPRFLIGLPAVLQGFAAGVRVRQPVRPAVSRTYRRGYLDFGSHFRPVKRLRHIVVDDRAPDGGFRQYFWADRPALYPRTATAFRVP